MQHADELWKRKKELDSKWDELMKYLKELRSSGKVNVEDIEKLEDEFLKIQKEYWRLMAELRRQT